MPYRKRYRKGNTPSRRSRNNDGPLIIGIILLVLVVTILNSIASWISRNGILAFAILIIVLSIAGYILYKRVSRHKQVDEQPKNSIQQTVLDKHFDSTEFRNKFPAKYRTDDGHQVRSISELAIDNWLFKHKIIHEYEGKLPITEDLYCDFFIPTPRVNVYVEFWGMDTPEYRARKTTKLEIYSKYKLTLLNLFPEDVANLQDRLPSRLRSVGIHIDF